MNLFAVIAITALLICVGSCIYHFTRLVKYGPPNDFSERKGNIGDAIRYSYTGAMSPTKKESAYMHLPTYTAGILYHLGTFLAIIILFLQLAGIEFHGAAAYIFSSLLLVSAFSGTAILIKRIAVHKLSSLSCADDYISNILVTLFQFASIVMILKFIPLPLYYLVVTLLLLYIPVGKLRHLVYFFAARYQLGYFYGWRGSWPPVKRK